MRSFLHMRTPSTEGRAKGTKLQRVGRSDGLLQALICGAKFIAEALQGCLDALAALVKTSLRDEAVPLGFDFFPLLLCFHGPEMDLNPGFVPELCEISFQSIKSSAARRAGEESVMTGKIRECAVNRKK